MAQVDRPPADDPQVTVTMARTTAVLLRCLLADWIVETETQPEVPIAAMRDWHRLADAAGKE